MINFTIINNVIGARGINPIDKGGITYTLIDRLNGNGIQIYEWDVSDLGVLPTEDELTRGESPLISLDHINTELGFIVTASLVNGNNQLISWRCIPPIGEPILESALAVEGVDSWEIEVPNGTYIIQAWTESFGFAQLEIIVNA